jgi:hypothetical protein
VKWNFIVDDFGFCWCILRPNLVGFKIVLQISLLVILERNLQLSFGLSFLEAWGSTIGLELCVFILFSMLSFWNFLSNFSGLEVGHFSRSLSDMEGERNSSQCILFEIFDLC